MELSKNPVGVKLTKGDEALLRQVCEDRGENLSSFLRRALKRELASLSYYDEGVKKSLGVLAEPKRKESLED